MATLSEKTIKNLAKVCVTTALQKQEKDLMSNIKSMVRKATGYRDTLEVFTYAFREAVEAEASQLGPEYMQPRLCQFLDDYCERHYAREVLRGQVYSALFTKRSDEMAARAEEALKKGDTELAQQYIALLVQYQKERPLPGQISFDDVAV